MSAGDFSSVALQYANAESCSRVPDSGRVVERAGEQLVAVSIEMQTHDFSGVACEGTQRLARFDVPELGGVVLRKSHHRSSREQEPVGVEVEADDLCSVASKGVIAAPVVGVPNLGCSIE